MCKNQGWERMLSQTWGKSQIQPQQMCIYLTTVLQTYTKAVFQKCFDTWACNWCLFTESRKKEMCTLLSWKKKKDNWKNINLATVCKKCPASTWAAIWRLWSQHLVICSTNILTLQPLLRLWHHLTPDLGKQESHSQGSTLQLLSLTDNFKTIILRYKMHIAFVCYYSTLLRGSGKMAYYSLKNKNNNKKITMYTFCSLIGRLLHYL